MGFLGPLVAVRFSPKMLGLNTGIFRLFSGSLGLIFGLRVLFFLCYCKKMNNLLVV